MTSHKRGGRRNEAAAINGKAVGRPPTIGGTQHKVTIDHDTLEMLSAIDDNLSIAIRTLARRLKD